MNVNDRLNQSVAGALLQASFPQPNVNQNGLFKDGRQIDSFAAPRDDPA